ncbi:MAG: C25 family cysteine peptidase [Bacteroidales bacterium]|nr:C25 family cysteine peptidase [Bacteroidales bacterium]
MNQELITFNSETYQRLSILGGQKWGIPGYPELPSIGKLLAIPENDRIDISVVISDSLIFNGYNVYPTPAITEDTTGGDPQLVELFVKNDSVYGLNQSFPPALYKSESGGYLRSQKVLKMSAFPIKFNPSTHQLVVYTRFEVVIQFQNPLTDVNVNTGIFNRLAKCTLLNYTDQSVPPTPIYPCPYPGTVTWKTLVDPAEASNIVADYVIITDSQFFYSSHKSPALITLANHRAKYNGFDVVIVSVQNILTLPFAYDPPPIGGENWISERKIRAFIKQVYDGQHAAHTYDGKVAFVCLVGHASLDDDDTGMPASYDPYPTGQPGYPGVFWSANDYYFSCVTKDNTTNDWDLLGDLFIGRLSARNESDLYNIISKTRHNENEYSFENWKSVNTLAYGGPFWGADPNLSNQYFNIDLPNWLNSIYNPVYTTTLVNSHVDIPWNQHYVDHLNTTGSNIVFHLGHGEIDSWCQGENCYNENLGALPLGYKMTHLANTGKYPFVISQSCFTGAYTGVGPDCMGTKTVSYSSTAGYVGYLGSWKAAGMNYTQPVEFPRSLQEHILGAIYIDLSTIIGEAVLEARIGVSDPTYVTSFNPLHFQHNLFADPAYNVLSTGYEITHNTTLPPPPPRPQTTTISTKVYVRAGVTLSLTSNAILEFSDNGQLIVENGAILEIGNAVTIKGQNALNKIIIEGTLCGPGGSISNPVPITDLHLISLNGTIWGGVEFNNPQLIVKLNGCSLSNSPISGELMRFEVYGSTAFSNSRINLNQSGLLIDGCTLTNSNILLTNNNESGIFAQILNSSLANSPANAMIRIEHYPAYSIQNCTLNYEHGTGIDLYFCGCSNGQYLIKNNTIQKSGSSQDLSWGIKVYHSFADIENNLVTNNRYGVVTLNQSQVRLIGNASASSSGQTQRIINNYQNQVRASDNSFPFYFHYNIIQNTPSGSTFLVYYDNGAVINPPASDNSTLFNVKCNCFDNSNPTPQLYPSGWYQWSVWCPPSTCQYSDQGKEDFEAAVTSMDAGDYEISETQFKAVIANNQGTTYARESAKKLIPLKKLSDQDFTGLAVYFDTTAALHSDSLTDQLIYRLKNMCSVAKENYTEAIDWFENDIMNPASENDSVYSLIDLSDTYMLMQADSGLKSSMANYMGTFAQYKPKNRQEHTIRSDEWIKLIFKDKPFDEEKKPSELTDQGYAIDQNNPNPFRVTTQLSYTIPISGTVSILVTNISGLQVLKIDRWKQDAGQYTLTLDLSGKPDGIYFVSLVSNGENMNTIRIIKKN